MQDFQYAEPGLAIKYFIDNEEFESKEKLFGLLSTVFSLAIFEQRDQSIEIGDTGSEFKYFAKPYEPFCKENIGFMLKLLSNINYDAGLASMISD